MKSNEIRVGNIILFSGFETKVIPQDFANQCRGVNSSEIPNFNPIPLNEEWLIKFGFEKDDSGVDMFDQDYCEWYQKEFPVIGILCQSSDKSYIFDENTDTLRLKYVHEIQNLYFALTGEELVFSSTE